MAGGIVAILRGRPVHPVGPDGRMAVSDHLRELRSRLILSALVFGVLFVVALFYYHQLFDLVGHPYNEARKGHENTMPTTQGVTGGFVLYMKVCGWAAVFVGVWLLGAILGRIADRLVRALMLGGLNRFAGTLFGAAKGAALLGFTLHLIEQTAPASGMSRVIAASRLGRPLEQVAGQVAQRGRELGIAPVGQHA